MKLTESQKKMARMMSRPISDELRQKNIERQKILQELFQFSRDYIEKFNELCAPEIIYYKPGTEEGGDWGKYNYYSQNVIDKNGYMASVDILYENSYDDFFDRWNKFKNLRVFL
jgi:hypothetical protein